MFVNRHHVRCGSLVLLFALLVIAGPTVLPVRAAPSAFLVYDHGLAEGVRVTQNGNLAPINKTSSFTQDTPHVYAYALAAFYSANLTWSWFDPSGELFWQATGFVNCESSPCYLYSRMPLAGSTGATRFGLWRMELSNDNFRVYTDYFYVSAILTQEDNWSFDLENSTQLNVHGNLTVTIHPNNGTWSYYSLYMPYAANLTASESGSGAQLTVSKSNASLVVVNLGAARSNGYSFIIDFEMQNGIQALNGFDAGEYLFVWQDQPWERFNDPHAIYETFRITLPKGASLMDTIGWNTMALKYSVAQGDRLSITLDDTLVDVPFGWFIFYRDLAYHNAHPTSSSSTAQNGFSVSSGPNLPILPLTLRGINVWSAVMSVFLLTASEVVSPIYSRWGATVLINRKRLRLAALLLVAFFLITTAYQLYLSQSNVTR